MKMTGMSAVTFAYGMLHCPFLYRPEVSVLNKDYDPSTKDPRFVVGVGAYTSTYTKDDIPKFKDLFLEAKQNNFTMSCVAAFDEDDTDRVVMISTLTDDLEVEVYFNRPGTDDRKEVEKLINYLWDFKIPEGA